MSKLAVGWSTAQEILHLYHVDKDEFGRAKWTLQGLADKFGIGESTVFRVVNRKGPYRALKRPLTEGELEVQAKVAFENIQRAMKEEQRDQESGATTLSALEKMMKQGQEMRDDPGLAERLAAVKGAKAPRNPLDE